MKSLARKLLVGVAFVLVSSTARADFTTMTGYLNLWNIDSEVGKTARFRITTAQGAHSIAQTVTVGAPDFSPFASVSAQVVNASDGLFWWEQFVGNDWQTVTVPQALNGSGTYYDGFQLTADLSTAGTVTVASADLTAIKDLLTVQGGIIGAMSETITTHTDLQNGIRQAAFCVLGALLGLVASQLIRPDRA